MFFKRILSEGLSHYSYLFGEGGKGVVFDPRLDYEVYLDTAAQANLTIDYIFETHRNEDILLGSKGLAKETGARVFISGYEELDYKYGEKVNEADVFELPGELLLRPLHTPGHTLGHLSYVLEFNSKPYMVFTGDSLFYGGVGRTDFYGKSELKKMTTMLYESIYKKLAKLGGEVLVMPAHAFGSACGGTKLDEIPYSTIGFELANNKLLSADKKEFLKLNSKMYYKNPMFEVMERLNPIGGGVRAGNGVKVVDEVAAKMTVIDVRDRLAFLAGHIPGALFFPPDKVDEYAGWFVKSTASIALVTDGLSNKTANEAYKTLLRMGHKRLAGVFSHGAIKARETNALPLSKMGEIYPREYLALVKKKPADAITLDIRLEDEIGKGEPLFNVLHIPLQEIAGRIGEVPTDKKIYVLCGTGDRSTMVASYIASILDIVPIVISGGMKGLEAAK